MRISGKGIMIFLLTRDHTHIDPIHIAYMPCFAIGSTSILTTVPGKLLFSLGKTQGEVSKMDQNHCKNRTMDRPVPPRCLMHVKGK